MIESARAVPAGTCRHLERAIYRRGRLRSIALPIHIGVIRHAVEGIVLFDTGWAARVDDELAAVPGHRRFLQCSAPPGHSARDRLAAAGIDPGEVAHIVVSHLHLDHVGGLRDFPHATVHLSYVAWNHVQQAPAWQLRARGFLAGLLPDDAIRRTAFVGDLAGPAWGPFPATHDVFGDGSIRLVDLPGHAPGQLGALVEGSHGHALFCGDAAYTTASIHDGQGPSRALEHLLYDDPRAGRDTLQRLHRAWRDHPGLRLVPSHCPAVPDGDLLS